MISVVVPIYNAQEHIIQCIDSILNQTYKDTEIILVDDGSTDCSKKICEDYERKYGKIKLIKNVHKGVFEARKSGVLNAKGDYITFVDSDDFIDKRAFELAEEEMNKNTDIIIFGICRFFNEEKKIYSYNKNHEGYYNKEKIEKQIIPSMIWNCLSGEHGIDPSLCNKIFKKEILNSLYLKFDKINFHYGEDIAITYPAVYNANSIVVYKKSYYYHRQRFEGNITQYLWDEHYFDNLYMLYKHLKQFFINKIDIIKQIDMFYIIAIQKGAGKYGINLQTNNNNYIFPFDKIKKNANIVLYGAGTMGRIFFRQINQIKYCNIVLWVDSNHKKLEEEIHSPSDIFGLNFDNLVVAIADIDIKKEVINYLKRLGVDERVIV